MSLALTSYQCPPLSGQDVQPACVVTQVATSSLSQNPVGKVRTGGVVAMLSEAPKSGTKARRVSQVGSIHLHTLVLD